MNNRSPTWVFAVDLAAMNSVQEEAVPGYFDPLPERLRSDGLAKAQWDWIEEKMKASTADYLLVAGHYPVSTMSKESAIDR